MKDPQPCKTCKGTGAIWHRGCDDSEATCHDCHGDGYIAERCADCGETWHCECKHNEEPKR